MDLFPLAKPILGLGLAVRSPFPLAKPKCPIWKFVVSKKPRSENYVSMQPKSGLLARPKPKSCSLTTKCLSK